MLTPLGESLLFTARHLAKRPEPRKVLLCLTDEKPMVCLGDDSATHAHARDSIRRIERAGIDVGLVGIMEDCVHDLHRRAVVVEELDNLPRAVMNQMRKMLSRDADIARRNTSSMPAGA